MTGYQLCLPRIHDAVPPTKCLSKSRTFRILERQKGTFTYPHLQNSTATARLSSLQDCFSHTSRMTGCSCPFHLLGQDSTRPSPPYIGGSLFSIHSWPTNCRYTRCSNRGSSSSFSPAFAQSSRTLERCHVVLPKANARRIRDPLQNCFTPAFGLNILRKLFGTSLATLSPSLC